MSERPEFDVLIENGTVVDGSGGDPYVADVGISGGFIRALGDLGRARADARIDASGLVVCPGFIDAHCHTDTYAAAFPGAEGKILQGVTTDVCGLCGDSAAPIGSGFLELRRRSSSAIAGPVEEITFGDYADRIDAQGNATNMAMFVGNGNLRVHAMGYENRPASSREMALMKGMLRDAMEAGAFGLSTGLTYVPSQFASTAELVELCKAIAPYGGIYNSHMRNEGARVEESVREVIEIARLGGCRGHISHLKAAGKGNFGKSTSCLRLIEEANRAGLNITFDVYPYTASSISLGALLPSWVLGERKGADFGFLEDPAIRRRISEDLGRDDWDNIILSCGYECIYISEANGCHRYEGKSLSEIAGELKISEFDAFLRVLVDSEGRSTIVYHAIDEGDLKAFLRSPYCVIGTDAFARHYTGPTAAGKPHPRNYGAFPRFLRRYVLEQKLMSLAEGIRKASGSTAEFFGLRDRGLVGVGYAADLLVFDQGTIGERGDYASPNVQPSGISHVLVDGKIVVRDGSFTGLRAGRMVLRA